MNSGTTTYDPATISSDPLPMTTETLSSASDTFVKVKRLNHIFTLHDSDNVEEYDNTNNDHFYIYYTNTT